jgi:uncharacterized protein YqeY
MSFVFLQVTDAEVLSVIQKMAKQRRDSIDQYKAGGRDDLAGGVLLCHVTE